MASSNLVPVVVQGRLLKTELESSSRTRIRESDSYLVWSAGASVSGRVPVHFVCAADETRGPAKGTIRKSVLESWLPATALLNVPKDASGIASGPLEKQCEEDVRYSQECLPSAGMQELAFLLSTLLDTEVRVSMTPEQGILSIDFRDLDDLERICSVMSNDSDD